MSRPIFAFLLASLTTSTALAAKPGSPPALLDCPAFLALLPNEHSSLPRLFEHEGLTAESFAVKSERLPDGTSGPRVYRAKNGNRYVLKQTNANLEVAAYRIDRALGLGVVPVTDWVEIAGVRYSAQQFVEANSGGWRRLVTVSRTETLNVRPPVNAELAILDALLANMDRGYPRRMSENYFVLEHADGTRMLVAIDNGTTHLGTLRSWLDSYDGFAVSNSARTNLPILEQMVKEHPEIVAKLRAWDEAKIRKDLAGVLTEEELAPLLRRRLELLAFAD